MFPTSRRSAVHLLVGRSQENHTATEGVGASLLALQAADGWWGGASWNRGWDSTMHVLMLLRDLGLDPASEEARSAVGLVRDRVTWQG